MVIKLVPESKKKRIKSYSKTQLENDEKNFSKFEDGQGKVDWLSFQRLVARDMYKNTKILDTGYIGSHNIDEITSAIKYPRRGWRILLDTSEELMRCSTYYYRMNMFFSNMALFCWGVDLCDIQKNANTATLKSQYSKLVWKLESMNLKHEFSKIMKYLPYQDIYCGLLFEDDSGFFMQQISYKVCKLYEIEDGLFNFAIDLSSLQPKELSAYPDYVKQAYIDFLENKNSFSRYYVPPSDKQICIKLNSQWNYPFPLLIGLIRDILDLDIYKKLKLQSARTDNYKAIMMKVPIDENAINKPLLTPEVLATFASINKESMNDDIGMLYTVGSDGEPVSFKDSSNTRNNVSDAVNELYNASGETKEAFNGSSSGTAVTFSIENDSGFIYGLYRQFERWTNRFIKLRRYNGKTFKFHFYLLDITIFNRKDVSQKYKDACTLGAPVIDKWLSSIDMTPGSVLGSYILHNEVFDFYNKLRPLSSSYNSSATDSSPGRPTAEESGNVLGDSGEITRDADSNKDR